jgi:hypothetical protein
MAKSRTSLKRVLREWPLIAVFGCIVFMVSPVITADFGLIDDHEIISFTGRDGQVSTHDLVTLIQQRAIEENGRFRPGYYVSRILESFLVGGNARLWHLNRLILALGSAAALYLAMRVPMPPFPAGIATLLFFAGAQSEIWIALGPAETYGIPLVLIGLAWIVVQLGRRHPEPTALFPGLALLLLAGFVKESFIPVLPAALVFVYLVLPRVKGSVVPGRPRLEATDIVLGLAVIAGVVVQVWMTARMMRTYGHVHSGTISTLASLLAPAGPMVVHYSKHTLWILPVLAGVLTLVPTNKLERARRGWRAEVIQAIVLLTTAAVLILAPQWVVYGATESLAGRYLTPGNLFPVFAAALGLCLLWRNPVTQSRLMLRGSVAGLLIAVALASVIVTRREATSAAKANQQFQAKLAEIVQAKTQYPEFPLLFYSADTGDREPLYSVATFLTAKLPDPGERPFLNPFDWETKADSPLEKRLAELIAKQSLEGDEVFAKIADFHGVDGRCIAVVFSGFSEDTRCHQTVYMHDR